MPLDEGHQQGGWDQGLQPSNHFCQLEKGDSKLQAVDALDIARLFLRRSPCCQISGLQMMENQSPKSSQWAPLPRLLASLVVVKDLRYLMR
jgi:hypothetical protein